MWITDKENNCTIVAHHFTFRGNEYSPYWVFNCPEGRFIIDLNGLGQRFPDGDLAILDPSVKPCKSDSGIRNQILKIHERIVSGDLAHNNIF